MQIIFLFFLSFLLSFFLLKYNLKYVCRRAKIAEARAQDFEKHKFSLMRNIQSLEEDRMHAEAEIQSFHALIKQYRSKENDLSIQFDQKLSQLSTVQSKLDKKMEEVGRLEADLDSAREALRQQSQRHFEQLQRERDIYRVYNCFFLFFSLQSRHIQHNSYCFISPPPSFFLFEK